MFGSLFFVNGLSESHPFVKIDLGFMSGVRSRDPLVNAPFFWNPARDS